MQQEKNELTPRAFATVGVALVTCFVRISSSREKFLIFFEMEFLGPISTESQ